MQRTISDLTRCSESPQGIVNLIYRQGLRLAGSTHVRTIRGCLGGIEVNDRHTVVVWDRLAELCAQHVRAGTRIYAESRLTTRHWFDRETGERRCRTEIHATNVIFLGGVQQTNLMPGYCEHIPEELFEEDGV